MKITDLQTTESLKIGDTIISANDLSLKYIDRTNTQFLNKLEYPKLWELYKTSEDKFIDTTFLSASSAGQVLDTLETDTRYLSLCSNDMNLTIRDKDGNLLLSANSGISANSTRFIAGDNDTVIIYDFGISNANTSIYYSNNFDIKNNVIGTFTTKTITYNTNNSIIRNCIFLVDYFIIAVGYSSSRFIYFKINKNNLSDIENISGKFETDVLLNTMLFNSVDFFTNNKFTLPASNHYVFLENNEIYFYSSMHKTVYKTNQSNPYLLEIYENLSEELKEGNGNIKSFAYYKNSFFMSFIHSLYSNTEVTFLINDNNTKIKNSSLINYNIPKNSAEVLFFDFINKKIITKSNGNTGNITYYNNFNMNSKNYLVFNNRFYAGSSFISIADTLNIDATSKTHFHNKNPIFIRSLNLVANLENGTNSYDTFKADFVKGEFLDNFTMPAINSFNAFDKYWTKKG